MKINQKSVDELLFVGMGAGPLADYEESLRRIQSALQVAFDVSLSLNECYMFWEWRSQEWDASFLFAKEGEDLIKEVREFFPKYLGWVRRD